MAESLEAKIEKYSYENIFLHKYCILKKKCDILQQSNERIVNRIQHVKKLIKRFKKERRFLSNKLDEHGDSYRDTPVPVMWEEDQMYQTNRMQPKSPGEAGEEEVPAGSSKGSLGYSSLLEMTGEGALPSALAKVRKMKADKKEASMDGTKKQMPTNAFLTFWDHQKDIVQDDYYQQNGEEISHHELTKRLAFRWNNLNPEKKQVYYDVYESTKDSSPCKNYISQEASEELDRKESEEAAVAAANLLADDNTTIIKEEMDP